MGRGCLRVLPLLKRWLCCTPVSCSNLNSLACAKRVTENSYHSRPLRTFLRPSDQHPHQKRIPKMKRLASRNVTNKTTQARYRLDSGVVLTKNLPENHVCLWLFSAAIFSVFRFQRITNLGSTTQAHTTGREREKERERETELWNLSPEAFRSPLPSFEGPVHRTTVCCNVQHMYSCQTGLHCRPKNFINRICGHGDELPWRQLICDFILIPPVRITTMPQCALQKTKRII